MYNQGLDEKERATANAYLTELGLSMYDKSSEILAIPEKVLAKLDKIGTQYRTAPVWAPLHSLIATALDKNHIDKVVSLELGDLPTDASCGRGQAEAWFQKLGVILAIVEQVKAHHRQAEEKNVQLIFQDSGFLPGDERLFAALGGKVVDGPEAKTCIDQNALVVDSGTFLAKQFEYIIQQNPGIYLGSSLEMWAGEWFTKTLVEWSSGPRDKIKDEAIAFLKARHMAAQPDISVPEIAAAKERHERDLDIEKLFVRRNRIYWLDLQTGPNKDLQAGSDVRSLKDIQKECKRLKRQRRDVTHEMADYAVGPFRRGVRRIFRMIKEKLERRK